MPRSSLLFLVEWVVMPAIGRAPMNVRIIFLRHPQLIRAAVYALAVGLGCLAGGCGGPAGSGTPAEGEKVPEGIVKLKEAMKERAAAKKGRSVGSRATPGGR
jgi:hypothetical protein